MSHLALLTLLETRVLPGWPEVYQPSVLDILLLTVGIPFALLAVLALGILGPHWFRQSRGTTSGEVERKVEPADNK